ncbi:hypothetical protein ACFV3E_24625 [Streptomyces sp. NPDC059718]
MEKPEDPEELYRALGEEVNPDRLYLTGDVFENVAVLDTDGTATRRTVMILDHPCSLRTDGVTLTSRLLVAEVRRTPKDTWSGCYNRMWLPAPFPGADGKANPCAAFFDACYHVSPEQLSAGTRIACLHPYGINLLLQRRVKHFSRVTVETHKFHEANLGVYEEADLIEDWCLEREDQDVKADEAVAECAAWLGEKVGDRRRRELLADPQQRSTVRKQMYDRLRELRTQQRP